MRSWGVRRGVIIAVMGCVMVAEVAVATRAGATLLVRNDAQPAAVALPTSSTTLAARHATPTTVRSHVEARPAAPQPKAKPAAPKPKPKPKPAVVNAQPQPKPAAAPKPATLVAAPPPAPAPPAGCPGGVAGIVWPSGWNVVCEGGRSGLLGLTYPSGTTYLYVRSGESDSYLRIVALHEAGHAWDFARLDTAKIAQWCAARGCNAAGFFSGGGSSSGYSEPGGAEDWAAVWDACHGGEYHRSYMGLGPPSSSQCALQNTLTGYPG